MKLPIKEPDFLIALGSAACKIANKIQYFGMFSSDMPRSLYFDYEEHEKHTTILLPNSDRPEDYEKDYNINWIPTQKENVLFIVTGGTHSSSASLSILEKFKHCKITILYIYPEEELLNEEDWTLNRMTFNVLQEMTRSGIFERFLIIENEKIDELLGGLAFIGKFEKINETIIYSLNLLFECAKLNPVQNYLHKLPTGTRISSLSIGDNIDTLDVKAFYDISDITDIQLVFFISEEKLKTDTSLQKKIKNKIKKLKVDNEIRVSYTVFSWEHTQEMIISINSTSFVQKINGEKQWP